MSILHSEGKVFAEEEVREDDDVMCDEWKRKRKEIEGTFELNF